VSLYRTALGALGGSPSLGALAAKQGSRPWFDFGTLDRFTNTGATIPATVGDPVASWRDVSRGMTVSQDDPTLRPLASALGVTFDGVDDYLQLITPLPGLSFAKGGTIAAWVFRKVGDTGARKIVLSVDGFTSIIVFSTARFDLPGVSFFGTTLVPIGSWAMITCATYSASDHRIYLNGVLDGISTAVRVSSTPVSISIGNNAVSNGPMNGAIGRVRAWDYALSASEIAALFAAERGIYGV
jgi:hypothetical protein